MAVFTDYDADGVNSAAVLATGLRMVGIEPRVRLPNRFVDGYGLTPAIVDELAAAGAQVIVTADCGSTAHDAADLARKLGVDLIVTDHHQCPPTLPNALRAGQSLAPRLRLPVRLPVRRRRGVQAGPGAGRCAAARRPRRPWSRCSTWSRSPPSPTSCRCSAKTVGWCWPGCSIMNAFPRPGVRALIETSGLKPGDVDAAALGFRVAPRVNAAGRLDDPNLAYRLLMSDSYEEAFELAAEINRLNEERQALTREYRGRRPTSWSRSSSSQASTPWCAAARIGQAASSAWWRASSPRAYNRPTLVYRRQRRHGHRLGPQHSGLQPARRAARRATTSSSATAATRPRLASACRRTACDELIERFQATVRETLPPERLEPVLWIDGYLKPETICYDFARSLERLAPFGMGFQYPTFAARDLRADREPPARRRQASTGGRACAPSTASRSKRSSSTTASSPTRFRVGSHLDAAFRLKRSRWDGYWRLEMELLDVATAD